MFVITIQFLCGSYHATPWGRHVNEGIPEWPPSSWRLLRAIIATWKNIKPELKDEKVLPIIKKLASELPNYNLPDASVSHTRHYMPTNKKSQLIINTFVVTGDKPIHLIWDSLTLDQQEIQLLDTILENLHYFGRAESWCTVTTSTDNHESNCKPLKDQEVITQKDIVSVLTPNKDIKFIDNSDLSKESDNNNLRSISITTKTLQDKNYIDPPGGRWIPYSRPQNCFEEKITNSNNSSTLNNITLARYAVVGTIRPSIKDTLRIGDMARSACMSIYGKNKNKETSATFSGKDYNGKPLVNHEHALYLPTYETQNMVIDHLTIIATRTFNPDELDVLFALKKLYRYNMPKVELLFQGCGTLENFSDISILKKSKIWTSSTPLILSRHIKYNRGPKHNRHTVDGPEDQIRNEIASRYNSTYELKDIKIEKDTKTNINKTPVKPFEFFRWRQHGSVGDGNAYNVRLEFKKPVIGPILLGYASHFGLGIFVPTEENNK